MSASCPRTASTLSLSFIEGRFVSSCTREALRARLTTKVTVWQLAAGCQYGAPHGSASSWMENRLTPNGLQRAGQGHVRPHLPPFASVAHVCDIEMAVPQVLQTRKTGLEKWRDRVWTWTRISGHEVEIAASPLREDIHDIVPAGVLRRRLDVRGLQFRFDQLARHRTHFILHTLWHNPWRCRSPRPLPAASWRDAHGISSFIGRTPF